MELIRMIAAFDTNGNITPLRFRRGEETVKVDKVVSCRFENVLGSMMHVFRCENVDEFGISNYVICFEPKTCMWWLKVCCGSF
jgi:hypothetical protein